MKNLNVIKQLMKEKSYKGNPKNYAVLVNDLLMDVHASYRVIRSGEDKDTIRVLHKRLLKYFLRDDISELFWDTKHGIRSNKCRKAKNMIHIRKDDPVKLKLEELKDKKVELETNDGGYFKGILTTLEYTSVKIQQEVIQYPVAIILDNDPEKGINVFQLKEIKIAEDI